MRNAPLCFFVLLLMTATALHVSEPRAGWATDSGSIELAYDDGTSDKSCLNGPGYVIGAVRFSPSFESSRIVAVRYYIGITGMTGKLAGNQQFNVMIFDANQHKLYEQATYNTQPNGWLDVSLAENIEVEGEFYAGMGWSDYGPCLGVDSSNPSHRSFSVEKGWTPYTDQASRDANLMIRAIVTSVAQTTTSSAQTTTSIAPITETSTSVPPVTRTPVEVNQRASDLNIEVLVPTLLIASTVLVLSVVIVRRRRKRETISPDFKYCVKCGSKLPTKAMFCDACGTSQVTE